MDKEMFLALTKIAKDADTPRYVSEMLKFLVTSMAGGKSLVIDREKISVEGLRSILEALESSDSIDVQRLARTYAGVSLGGVMLDGSCIKASLQQVRDKSEEILAAHKDLDPESLIVTLLYAATKVTEALQAIELQSALVAILEAINGPAELEDNPKGHIKPSQDSVVVRGVDIKQ
jgi:hypothetical protein